MYKILVGILYLTVCQAWSHTHMLSVILRKSLLFVVLDVFFIRYDLFFLTPCVVAGWVMNFLIFSACRNWVFIAMFLLIVSFKTCWHVMRLNVETEVFAEVFVRRCIFRLVVLYEFQKIRKCSEKSFVKKWKAVIINNFKEKKGTTLNTTQRQTVILY